MKHNAFDEVGNEADGISQAIPAAPRRSPVRVDVPPIIPNEHKSSKKESYTLQDAERHAEMIRRAWAKAGHKVDPLVSYRRVNGKLQYFVTMPDMVNGLPLREFSK